MTNRKRKTRMVIDGLYMTEQRQQQVSQAVRFALAHQLDGEIDGITITFAIQEML